MKTIFLFVLLLINSVVMGQGKSKIQDDIYLLPPTGSVQKFEANMFKNNIEKVQYCLGRYYKERQVAITVSITSTIFTGAYVGTNISEQKTLSKSFIVLIAIADISSIVLFIDAEKWIKRASINISPASLTINF